MNKIKTKRIVKYILILLWMIVIFKFSADPATISDSKSGKVINLLISMGIDVNGMFGSLANFVIRKLGHITEYFILYSLIIFATIDEFQLINSLKIGFIVTFIYACSDEFHQLFVVGRSGRVIDVFIDLIGAIISMIIIYLYKKIRDKQ